MVDKVLVNGRRRVRGGKFFFMYVDVCEGVLPRAGNAGEEQEQGVFIYDESYEEEEEEEAVFIRGVNT